VSSTYTISLFVHTIIIAKIFLLFRIFRCFFLKDCKRELFFIEDKELLLLVCILVCVANLYDEIILSVHFFHFPQFIHLYFCIA